MKTLVQNISGADKHFTYIPPHGRDIEADETITLDGDLRSVLASGRNRYSRSQELAALEADCAGGVICLTEVVEDCCSSSSSSA